MKGKTVLISIFFLCGLTNVYSQEFLSNVISELRKDYRFDGAYMCYETNIDAYLYLKGKHGISCPFCRFQHLNMPSTRKELMDYLCEESIDRLDSMSKISISIKKELKDCKIKNRELVSKEKSERLYNKRKNIESYMNKHDFYLKWYQFRKRLIYNKYREMTICFFSIPLQVENYEILEVTLSFFRGRIAFDTYIYIYNKESGIFKEIFVGDNY